MQRFIPKTSQQGFTLMEVMVAVSIFAIVVTVGIVSLLTINDSYRKSQLDRQAIDSLTYTLESMSRRIRTASEWDATLAYGTPDDQFDIIDQDGISVSYFWGGNSDPRIYMTISNPPGAQNPTVASGTYDITPANVQITDTNPDGTPFDGGGLRFLPLATSGGQPYVQINLGGRIQTGRQTAAFTFQTGVSKRGIIQ